MSGLGVCLNGWWLLTGRFTTSNLTNGGTIGILVRWLFKAGGHSRRFHCISALEGLATKLVQGLHVTNYNHKEVNIKKSTTSTL